MDIGLFLQPSQDRSDIALASGDLALDGTLRTSVILSLLCNAVADADDEIPDGSTNRRGWWFDAYTPALSDGTPDHWGSKLWLRVRCLATPQTALQIQQDCEDALAWMISSGVASDVAVTTSWASDTALKVQIQIARQNAAGQPYNVSFNLLWDSTLGTLSLQPGAPGSPAQVIPPHLGLLANGIVPSAFGIVYSDGVALGIATIGNGLVWTPSNVTLALGSLTWSNLPAEAQTSPLMLRIDGVPPPSTRWLISLPQNYVIPADFAGTTAFQGATCSADYVLTLSIISAGVETELGTVTLLPGGATSCALASSGAYRNLVADALVVETPAGADATLSSICIALMLQRI